MNFTEALGKEQGEPGKIDKEKGIKEIVEEVFQNRLGEVFSREVIIDLVVRAYPGTNRTSVIPSDYCYNIVNKGIPFTFHIFEFLGNGMYRCLGSDYPYTGPIHWKDKQVGEWNSGRHHFWDGTWEKVR